jgi:DNA segregation ATPase FtsK/SpoIIIE-like protein
MTLEQELAEQLPLARNALRTRASVSGSLTMGGCTSFIQRNLQCGYNRAATLIELLAQSGFISEPDDKGQRTLTAPQREV